MININTSFQYVIAVAAHSMLKKKQKWNRKFVLT